MPISIETQERETPIILIAGKNPFLNTIIEEFQKHFKIIHLSDEELPQGSEAGRNFYRIKKDSAHLIGDLEEKIDYAVIFLNGEEEKKYLEHLEEKLSENQTKTILLIDYNKFNNFNGIISDYQKIPTAYFLFLGEIYSEKDKGESAVSELIRKVIKDKSITLTGNDLLPIFPIYYKDAISGINQILFGPARKQKFYYLFYSHPQTYISAIHILRRAEPDLEIQYKEGEKVNPKITHEEIEKGIKTEFASSPSFLDKYFIGFEKSLQSFNSREIKAQDEEKTLIPQKIVPKKHQIKFAGSAVLSGIMLFIFMNIFFIAVGVLEFKGALDAFKKNDYKGVSGKINNAKLFLDITSPLIDIGVSAAPVFGIKTASQDYGMVKTSINLLSTASNDFGIIQKVPAGLERESLDRLIADATNLYFEAEKIRSQKENETLNNLITPDLSKMLALSSVAPQILGYDKEKNYLLLFENNGELRPTGGFIGSVGNIKIRGGKIESINIQDVYEYDGKLKAHVEPNFIIRRYLQPHLYLRDSNFDPDFQNSAKTAALIYKLETEKEVDGVIAIDFEVIKRIIKEIGPIKLTSYNKTLDDKNIFDFLESTIDNNFFPGSGAKREVLQALFDQLTLRIENDKNNFIKVARLLPILTDEKHILLAFDTKSSQAIFSSFGYGGEYKDQRITDSSTIPDFLSINEANIGVNKANINVTRKTEYEVTFDKKGITSKITHTLKNDGKKDNYFAYIRVIAPLGSNLKTITFDGEEQKIIPAVTDYKLYEDKRFKAPIGLEVDKTVEEEKQFFGFNVNVPAGAEKEIGITYDNGVTLLNSPITKYSLLVIKQPGTLEYPFELKINYGQNFAPQEVEDATLENGDISILKNLLTDREFQVKLIKR